jgi:hypothetical protein
MFGRKKQKVAPPATQPLTTKASPQTKKAIRFFNDKVPATDLLEEDKSKKFVHSGYTKTLSDKFFEQFESIDLWGTLAIIIATAFVASVAYWGIMQ